MIWQSWKSVPCHAGDGRIAFRKMYLCFSWTRVCLTMLTQFPLRWSGRRVLKCDWLVVLLKDSSSPSLAPQCPFSALLCHVSLCAPVLYKIWEDRHSLNSSLMHLSVLCIVSDLDISKEVVRKQPSNSSVTTFQSPYYSGEKDTETQGEKIISLEYFAFFH